MSSTEAGGVPTAMKMTAKQTSGRGAPASVTMTGKWLSDNCGDVK